MTVKPSLDEPLTEMVLPTPQSREASGRNPLRLSSGALLSPQSEGQRFYARFVRAGAVCRADGQPSNLVIETQALAAAVPLFNHRAVFLDHSAWFQAPSLERLIGVTRQAVFNPSEAAIEGVVELYDTPLAALASRLIAAVLADSNPPEVGLSIVFYPVLVEENGGERLMVRAIRRVESVDLVFQPAADGRLLQRLSAALSLTPNHGGQRMSETASPPQGAQAPAEAWLGELARSLSAQMIATSGLPEASRQRLSQMTFGHPQEVEEAIRAEREYLAALQESRVVQIGNIPPRTPQISGQRGSLERIQLALEALLAGTPPPSGVPPLSGIRELYHLLSGDYEMTGLFQGERVQFANVNSSTMANLVANALNKRLTAEFQAYEQWWRPIVLEEDFTSLQTIRWTLLGGVGELPTVAEGAAYTELTWDDSAESSAFVKKGGYLGLTLEAIDKDETGRLRSAPRALAQAAWLTLSKLIASVFTANGGVGPTLSDGKALFHADHGNLGNSPLTLSAYTAVRAAMRKQSELHSGERLGALTAPKFLLVPPELEMTALQVLASEADYTYTLSNGLAAPLNPNTQGNTLNERLAYARQRVIVVDLWTDANDWAAVCDPRLYPTIGVGYRYGRTPEIFSVASPTAGLMFTNDTMPIKVRFFVAVAPIDFRGLYKNNVP